MGAQAIDPECWVSIHGLHSMPVRGDGRRLDQVKIRSRRRIELESCSVFLETWSQNIASHHRRRLVIDKSQD